MSFTSALLELCSMLLMDHDMVTAVDIVDETSHFLRNSIPPPPSGWKFDTIPSPHKRAEKKDVPRKKIVVDSCELVVDGIYIFREALYNE